VFFRILGVIILYLEANSAGRLFQREIQVLVECCFIRGMKSKCGSREKEGKMRLEEDLADLVCNFITMYACVTRNPKEVDFIVFLIQGKNKELNAKDKWRQMRVKWV